MENNKELTTDEILKKFTSDFKFYASTCLKIQNEESQLIPFEFNETQYFLSQIVDDLKSKNLPIRLIILKSRRKGVSTWVEGYFYHKTSMRHNKYAVTVTHEPEATDFIFKMTKRFHQHCPKELRPEVKYSNMKLLEFNNQSGTGLDSAFRVGTAGKEDFGSGQLIHFVHLSEVTKWPINTQSSLLTSLLQCVPDDPETAIIFESTGKGIGGEFYTRFWAAKYCYEVFLDENREPKLKFSVNEKSDSNNTYCRIFFPWFIPKNRRKEVPPDFKKTQKEEQLAKLYNLDDSQLCWRRWATENRCNGNEDIFCQEYPSNPTESFLSSGRPVFNNQELLILKNAAPKPIARYECQISSGQWIAKEAGRLNVWEEPEAGQRYVIGADIAEGLEWGDYSSADIINQLTGVQVAQWYGKCDADEFGKLLCWLGKRYNWALVAPERNNHGIMTVTTLCDMQYPNIYGEIIIEPPNRPKQRYGWSTNKATRYVMIDNLIEIVRDKTHGIQCAETFEEMMNFKISIEGRMEAEKGQNDDRVISIAIAHQVRRLNPFKRSKNKSLEDGFGANTKRQPPPMEAFY